MNKKYLMYGAVILGVLVLWSMYRNSYIAAHAK